jgi:hypothetical protein
MIICVTIGECILVRAVRIWNHTRVYAVRGHNKYVAHATCGELQYVPSKFEENPSKDKRMLNHALARSHTHALARVYAVREH